MLASEYSGNKTKVKIINKEGECCYVMPQHYMLGCVTHKEASDAKKLHINEVKRRVNDTKCFNWIEGTKYISNNVPFEVQCNLCNNKCKITLNNIKGNRSGCSKCYRYNKTYTWEYYEDFAYRFGCTIVPLEEYKGRDTNCYIICNCTQRIEKSARNFLIAPRCRKCSKNLRANTNMEKYGSENVFGSEYGKERIKEWLNSKGVKGNMAIPEIRERAKETCMKNHGVPYYCMKPEVKKLAEESHMRNHGTRAFGPIIHEKCKKSMIERYGHEYPAQVAKFLDKAQKTRFSPKIYTFPSGRIESVMGYEPECLDLLLSEGYHEDDIVVGNINVPRIMYDVKGSPRSHRYYMDIYIKSEDRAIEVKCCYTYFCAPKINKAKWLTTSKICKGGITVYVFEKHARLLAIKRIINGKIKQDTQFIYENYKHPVSIPLCKIY